MKAEINLNSNGDMGSGDHLRPLRVVNLCDIRPTDITMSNVYFFFFI